MRFQHRDEIWRDFPELVAGVLLVHGITAGGDAEGRAEPQVRRHNAVAVERLAGGAEGQFAEIQAWRRAFAAQGLKPTQYRCASESLLRRLRKEGALPRLHPLVDLCNAVSMAFAVPVAALDVARIAGDLEVRYATGEERYETFGGELEHPDPREVIFADADGQAHARRWTNRQSGLSAIRPSTSTALIVTEGLHGSAAADVPALVAALAEGIAAVWSTDPVTAVLSRTAPAFAVAPAR